MTARALAGWLGPATPKLPGLQRARAPEETLALLEPMLWSRFGITRLATVTGLDRIGIPVVMAIRPNSRTLAVSQGKGTDLAAARASALMESLELWHAEQHRLPSRMAPWAQLVEEAQTTELPAVLDPLTLPRSFESMWQPDRALPWVQGVDLGSGRSTWVPYELVHADARLPQPEGSGCFRRSTNGLASGNTRAEASLHAICELIERDADALFQLNPEQQAGRRLDLATVDTPTERALLERYEVADIDVIAWDVTSDVGVATFRVVISDRTAEPTHRPLPAAYGAGTHPDREVALTRALTEAAQSRLTGIAGSRDDLTRATYRTIQGAEALALNRALVGEPARRRFTDVPSRQHDTVDDDVAYVMARLAAAGVGPVVAVDLSYDDLPVHVVRALIGGLEGAIVGSSYRLVGRSRVAAAAGADVFAGDVG